MSTTPPVPMAEIERALHRAEERLRLFAEASGDGLWEWDLENGRLEWSARSQELTGEQPGTLEAFKGLVHPKDLGRFDGALLKLLGSAPAQSAEVRLKRRDGDWGVFVVRARTQHDDARRAVRVVGSLSDWTDRRRAEAALLEGRERLASSVRGSADGHWDWDLETGSVRFSTRFRALLGWTEEELGGVPEDWLSRIHPDDLGEFKALMAAHLEGALPRFECLHRLRHSDGNHRFVLARGTAQRGRSGRAYCVAGSISDVSSHMQTEEMLRELAAGTAAVTGAEFFAAFAQHVAKAMDVPIALVTEIVPDDPGRLRTLAYFADGVLKDRWEYAVEGTPCQQVLEHGPRHYPLDVAGLFPEDKDLVEAGATSYIGVPLRGRQGAPIGHVCVIGRKPIEEHVRARTVLRIFAARAAVELERQRLESELRESQRRYELAVLGSGAGLWDWDLESGRVYLSPVLKAMLGYREDEPVGEAEAWLRRLHPDDAAALRAAIAAQVAGAQAPLEVVVRRPRREGGQLRLLVRGRATREAGGAARLSGVAIDVTGLLAEAGAGPAPPAAA